MHRIQCLLVGLLVFLMAAHTARSQSVLYPKWEPSFRLAQKFNEKWSAKLALGGLYVLGGLGNSEDVDEAHLDRLDARLFVTRKCGKLHLAGGYMYRKYGPLDTIGYEHRFTEELTLDFLLGTQKFANRTRLEQRIQDDGFVNRLRDRVSTKVELKGKAYLFFADEPVFSFNTEAHSLENRFDMGIGWQFNEAQKFQFTAEHRFRGTGKDQALHLITAYTYSF